MPNMSAMNSVITGAAISINLAPRPTVSAFIVKLTNLWLLWMNLAIIYLKRKLGKKSLFLEHKCRL